ncbi:MAG TPA: hypothetical protein DEA61_07320 [Caldanaerobacter subterraneus]|uniref:Polymerase nucleotidyl transferase domain-containing protein n=1 Tax=Caldanaerobacter subterraneus TaxID=911092 RepID=A0A357VPP4_9THEO|nr:nucleotidyltransferase domain-containing protein [Caldanaerobacter subterraneus]HBT49621.1 hypothetical protein [Caldanaerobacter subterraneus]
MRPTITDSAKEVICSELKLPFVHSVILIGSRARGDGNAKSDYDLYVVVPVSLLPLLFPILKKKEKILRERLKVDVSISPLTYSRMKRGKDTLLFHVKKEGVILCGKNIKSLIKINSVNELPMDELYQYFFDALFYLIRYFNLYDDFDQDARNKLIRNAAKCVLYCADLRLMITGVYAGSWKKIAELSNDKLVKDSYDIICGKLKIRNEFHFWFLARDYALETFKILIKKQYRTNLDLDTFSRIYLSQKVSILKSIQFFILAFPIFKKNRSTISIFWHILRRQPIDKYLHMLLLSLLSSQEDERNINILIKIMRNLGVGIEQNILEDLWNKGKEILEMYAPYMWAKSVI